MPQIRVFSTTLNGFLEYTGNTLGVTTVASTGIIAINALLLPTPVAPGGTTTALTNWRNAATSAFLTGFPGSTVVKAYLMWNGVSTPDSNGTSTNSNIAVTLTDPTGATNSISPNATWSQNTVFAGSNIFITRVQDVTSIVQAAGTGMYTVQGCPSGTNWSGWTMAVVWSNNAFPPRLITVDSFDDVNGAAGLNLPLTGFITPGSGNVTGRMAIAVGGAETNSNSGVVSFGPTLASLSPLSGPNNPQANFFQCQINNSNSESASVGLIDQTGTWGTRNTPVNTNPVANTRWHYDMTNVNITSGLTNNQRQGVLNFGSAGSIYIIHLVSLQIDAQAPSFEPTKTVDKAVASVGETLTYTLVISNFGNNGSNNAVFIDTLPTGTSFIPGSVELNGVSQPTATITIPSGFNAGPIAIGQTATVTFKATVNNVAPGSTLTNTFSIGYNYSPLNAATLTFSNNIGANIVSTTVLGTATIANTKTVSKAFANVGDVLQYTIAVKTFGNTSTNNISFIDTIPSGTTLIPNSFKVNGVTIVGGDPNPPSGVNLGTIPQLTTKTITFNVTVNTIPNPNPILNSCTSSGTFTQDPSIPNGVTTSANSNIVTTQINNANLGNITKTSSKTFVTCGDIITYTIVIPNSGNVTALNVIFKDTIPNGTILNPSSVFVNGVLQTGANPTIGVTIPNIAPGTTSTITFNVTVTC